MKMIFQTNRVKWRGQMESRIVNFSLVVNATKNAISGGANFQKPLSRLLFP